MRSMSPGSLPDLTPRVARGLHMPTVEGPVPTSNGVPTCSRCNGTSFVPRRKTSTKVMFGAMSLAGRPRHVECVTCGQMYLRPNVADARSELRQEVRANPYLHRFARCARCNAALESGARFCRECGAEIPQVPVRPPIQTQSSGQPFFRPQVSAFWLTVGAVLLLLVVGALASLAQPDGGTDDTSASDSSGDLPATLDDTYASTEPDTTMEPAAADVPGFGADPAPTSYVEPSPATVVIPTSEPCVSGDIAVSTVTITRDESLSDGEYGWWWLTATVTNHASAEIRTAGVSVEIAMSDFPDHYDNGSDIFPPRQPYYLKPGESVGFKGSFESYGDHPVNARAKVWGDEWRPSDDSMSKCGGL